MLNDNIDIINKKFLELILSIFIKLKIFNSKIKFKNKFFKNKN